METGNHRYILIVAGGGGTRLWPISRKNRPKQFQHLTGNTTLFQQMVGLGTQVVPLERIMVQTVPAYKDVILEQIPALSPENVWVEPALRDTGPAIALGLLRLRKLDPEAEVAILWSDHLVQNPAAFAEILQTAFAAVDANPQLVVTVGAKPTFPNTGFGYIHMGDELEQYQGLPVFRVREFKEKPDLETAKQYISSWEYLWNVGYEIMRAETFFQVLAEVRPDFQETITQLDQALSSGDEAALTATYEGIGKQSIEVLFTTHVKEMAVVPADMGWSDVGTWDILHMELEKGKENGIVSQGPVETVNTTNSLIYAKDRLISVVGLDNVVVVDSGDALLVMSKDAAQDIKKLVQKLEENNPELL